MDQQHLLILDLDETLVHATDVPLPRAPDFEIPPYALYLRPGVGEFLDWALTTFKVAVWTSSSPKYAEIVTSLLFEDLSKLEFVWARNRCTPRRDFERDVWWDSKPLHKVRRRGFDLRRVLAVDDNPEKYARSYGNLVAVSPYHGSLDDDELPHLRRYLEELAIHPNVRSVEKRFWRRRLEDADRSSSEERAGGG
ncbi:NIF family HAD-type phosphatase [Dyella kyungheensis]|uniref:NIF family HAD-type phosphatase n=1 Tax=Dyella kyungheensis TaxID=1242174 RepID=UPI003CEBF76A